MKNQKILYGFSALAVILAIVGFVLYGPNNASLIKGSVNKSGVNLCSTTIQQSDLDLSGSADDAYVITKPGTYCLGSNLSLLTKQNITISSGRLWSIINIKSDNVILDLKGYEIDAFDPAWNGYAIRIDNYKNSVIKNGKIRNGVMGIVATYADRLTISGLEINDVVEGLAVYFSNGLTIKNSKFIKSKESLLSTVNTPNYSMEYAIVTLNTTKVNIINNYTKNYTFGISVLYDATFTGAVSGTLDSNKTCNATGVSANSIDPAISVTNSANLAGNC